jgi:hypothetical protein
MNRERAGGGQHSGRAVDSDVGLRGERKKTSFHRVEPSFPSSAFVIGRGDVACSPSTV